MSPALRALRLEPRAVCDSGEEARFAGLTDAAFLRALSDDLPTSGGAPDIRGRIRSGVFDPQEFEPSRFRLVTALKH